MKRLQNNKIQVHRFLGELFGRETTSIDLLAILISAASFAAITLMLKWNADLSMIKMIVLMILAFDIGGGVVANFTSGTNNFYAGSLRKRYVFVFIHLLQPIILIWIYPDDIGAITSVTLFTLTSTIIVLNFKKQHTQRIVAATLLVMCLLLTPLIHYSDRILQLMMILYSIKLILAFSVNWTSMDES